MVIPLVRCSENHLNKEILNAIYRDGQHISNLDFAVVNDAGRLMKATSVSTNVKNFMEFVRKVPPPG
jgi:flavin-binding protein dodecin